MKLNKIEWVLDPQTFQRNLVANVDISLCPEAVMEFQGMQSLDLKSEMAKYIGLEILEDMLAYKPPIN